MNDQRLDYLPPPRDAWAHLHHVASMDNLALRMNGVLYRHLLDLALKLGHLPFVHGSNDDAERSRR
jgi:hypothetical protein